MSLTRRVTRSFFTTENFKTSCEILAYDYQYSDGGRSSSKRPKQKNDCTVRALAIATNLTYDDAYDVLAKAGRKCSKGFHFRDWAKNRTVAGYKLIHHSFPAVKGQRRMNLASFCERFPNGRYILKTAKHVVAVIDGILMDTVEVLPNRCVYSCWELVKS